MKQTKGKVKKMVEPGEEKPKKASAYIKFLKNISKKLILLLIEKLEQWDLKRKRNM